MTAHRLDRKHTALLVVDVQERLAAAMNPEAMQRVTQRARAAILGAKALKLPIVVAEQYPERLGPTLPILQEALGEVRANPKLQFSALTPEVREALGSSQQVLIVGMETHVCVFQTVRDLGEAGLQPFVCADAVLSRAELDRQTGLELCRSAGGVVTTVEAALFDLLVKAGTPEFKEVSAAVK